MPPSVGPRCRRCTAVATGKPTVPDPAAGRDESWPVAGAAPRRLGRRPGAPSGWRILARTDPHWASATPSFRSCMRWAKAKRKPGTSMNGSPALHGAHECRVCVAYHLVALVRPFVPRPCRYRHRDPYVAVPSGTGTRRCLPHPGALGGGGKRQALGASCRSARARDERVRAPAAEVVRCWGQPQHLATGLEVLDEPGPARRSVARLFQSLDLDRAEAGRRLILRQPPRPGPARLGLDQAGSVPFEKRRRLCSASSRGTLPASRRRRALARLACRWLTPAPRMAAWTCGRRDPEVQLAALRGWNRGRGSRWTTPPDRLLVPGRGRAGPSGPGSRTGRRR